MICRSTVPQAADLHKQPPLLFQTPNAQESRSAVFRPSIARSEIRVDADEEFTRTLKESVRYAERGGQTKDAK